MVFIGLAWNLKGSMESFLKPSDATGMGGVPLIRLPCSEHGTHKADICVH